MTYWNLKADESDKKTLTAFISGNELSLIAKRRLNDSSPLAVRRAFNDALGKEPILQVLEGLNTIVSEDRKLPDILSVGGVEIVFSEQAKDLIVRLGVEDGNFLAFRFTINRDEIFFIFLPEHNYDVIDSEQSQFLHQVPIPDKEPLLMFMESLVFKPKVDVGALPALFCAQMPGHLQSLMELFASDVLKQEWDNSALTGANFVKLQEATQK